ncbi:hypothetical protein ACFFLM_02670 [Deinococcus oregonensis]|uniref:Uncharacterized protein n=1 Tax=Deinococcus oregonensis TaxID=1805970 RepID=A0ABV6ATQ3_9DEIO
MRAAAPPAALQVVRWGGGRPAPATLVLHPSFLTAPLHAVLGTSPDLADRYGAVWSAALSESQQAAAHRLPAAVRELVNREGLSEVRLLLLDGEPAVQTALAGLFSAEVRHYVALSLPAGWRTQGQQQVQSFPLRALRKLLQGSWPTPPQAHLLAQPAVLAQRGAA